MPIDIETFESGDPEELAEPTNAERVLAFLAERRDKAFKQSEIADGAGVKRGSISTVLSRLHDRGLVRHKGEYWALTDDEDRLGSYRAFRSSKAALNDQLGAEDPADWGIDAEEDAE